MPTFARPARVAAILLAAAALPLSAQQPKPATPAHLGLGAAAPAIRTEADLTRFLEDLEVQR